MMQKTVTRFAPSPTGYMHIGNLRTALYAYLLARSNGGTFILRIEDTDRERLVEDAISVIVDTLAQAGLHYDEGPQAGGANGPYVQSERTAIYKEHAERLVASGHAYYCFCGKERLSSLHADSTGSGYDRHCRNLSEAEVSEKLAGGTPYVIRQKVPLEGQTGYTDAVFGEITINNAELQDTVLMKADGYPTYNFAHVVDDHLMGVTHVVRGSEYVTSTPLYVLLYQMLGWPLPHYVHLPLIMGKNADGSVSKLSKRHGAVSFQDLRTQGYLPESIINYIALLGWSPKTTNQEFFTLAELVEQFHVEEINKSPAVFDYDKLAWFNSAYIRKLPEEQFKELALPYVQQTISKPVDTAKILTLIQSRLEKISQIPELIGFFETVPDYNSDLFVNKKNKVTVENAKPILEAVIGLLEQTEQWSNDHLFGQLQQLADSLSLKSATVLWVTRIAVSGTLSTPGGATDILEILGKEESLARLHAGLEKL